MKLVVFLATCIAWSATAFAGPIHETYFYKGVPSQWDIDQWSGIPGSARGYIFEIDGQPFAADLKIIGSLRNADRVRVEISQYPDETTIDGWKYLVGKGVELIGFGAGIPSMPEIERLNRIGFASYVFVLSAYPEMEEVQRLAKLNASYSFTFAQNMLPRYQNLPSLQALPDSSAFLFVTNYWPWFSHMDVMNMLKQPKTIRVRNIYPSDQHFAYLLNIKGIDQVIVENDMDPPTPDFWAKFKELPLQWISSGRVPDEANLAGFEAQPSAKKLVIDSDEGITPEQRERLTKSRLAVEWVHSAPGTFLRNLRVQ